VDGLTDGVPILATSWEERLRLARARALAAGVTIDWDRLGASDEEREATVRLRERLPAEPHADDEPATSA
jgi:hypothetical protein